MGGASSTGSASGTGNASHWLAVRRRRRIPAAGRRCSIDAQRARCRHSPRARLGWRRAGPAARLVLAAGGAPFRGRWPHAASGGHGRDERRRLGARRPVRPGLPRRRPACRSPRRQRRPVVVDQRHREDRARHLRRRSARSRGAARLDRGFLRRSGRYRNHRQPDRREAITLRDSRRRRAECREQHVGRSRGEYERCAGHAWRGRRRSESAGREAHRPRAGCRARQAGRRAGGDVA